MTTTNDPAELAVGLHQRALSAMDAHRHREALALCRRALDLFDAHAGSTHPDVANVLSLLGGAEDELGAYAETHHRRAVAVMATLPREPGVLLRLAILARVGLGANLRRQGRYVEAGHELSAAPSIAKAAADQTDIDFVSIWNELGVLGKFAGRFDEAETLYLRAYGALEATFGPDAPQLAGVCHNLAGLAHSRGRPAEGEQHARRSLTLHRRVFPVDHPVVVADEAHLAALLQA
ncbi:hypothetical protein MCAG_05265 [Micromonospora sp. ATCC 39149]|uniref:Tetratricopeptide repeat protein n=1 Tax=Micromonospora carbonacea TaxID=47853 RepID=A0A7D6CG86_9ACTN|nr:tetratricopeptide repeat protein [Micromonospora sp. ATCC 39149]EEP74938.1 hypothetical protein MCAG_05265 [Micromonospora sp. ATCC 39149]QLK00693.1 tetratricopeptide repeat protein [Micromonospora carbonacea]